MISDPDKTVQRYYQSGRITYLIDGEGVIRHLQEGVPDNARLLEELRLLQ